MAKKTYSCGLEASLAVIGGKWKFLILWHLANKPTRFGELRRLVTGISEKMLIQELKEMIADQIVSRKDFQEIPPRVEYSLTSFGKTLAEALVPISPNPRQNRILFQKLRQHDSKTGACCRVHQI